MFLIETKELTPLFVTMVSAVSTRQGHTATLTSCLARQRRWPLGSYCTALGVPGVTTPSWTSPSPISRLCSTGWDTPTMSPPPPR